MMRTLLVLFSSIAPLIVLSSAQAHAQTGAAGELERQIVRIAGDLYDAREGQQHTIFLITPSGIIVGDPLNLAFAQWLKEQLAQRFPNLTVRYVLFTHHHFDRAHGGGVFTDADRVGHEAYNPALSNARSELPTSVRVQDRNGNRRFDPNELEGPDAALVVSRDRNGDGAVTLDELWNLVVPVKTSYQNRLAITLGGKNVDLVHTGDWHSPDMTVFLFRDERVLFAVDPPPVTTVPFSFGTARPRQVYDWLHAVAPLDFDTLVFGDGTTMRRSDLSALTTYLDELRAGVAIGSERHQTLDEVQASGLVQSYSGTPHYSGRTQQIAEVYRTLQLRRVTISAVGIANYSRVASSFCSSYTLCTAGGAVPAGSVDLTLWVGRTMAIGAEGMLAGQTWSTRRQPLYDEELALRQARGSVLVRWVPSNNLSISGGPSITYGDARGINNVRGRLVPIGGQHQIHERATRVGVAFGTEWRIPLTEKFTLVTPIQASYIPGTLPESWPNRLDVTAGAGVSIRLARHVN